MYIESGSRLHRAFMWSLDYIGTFRDTNQVDRYRHGTNLCHFVRVIAAYVPLVTACRLLAVAAIPWAALVYPTRLFGIAGYGYFWLWVAGVALVGLFVWAVGASIGFFRSAIVAARKKRPEKLHSALDVTLAYIKARKQRICPLIEFRSTP